MGLSGETISFASLEISGSMSKPLSSGSFSDPDCECVLAMTARRVSEKGIGQEKGPRMSVDSVVLTM